MKIKMNPMGREKPTQNQKLKEALKYQKMGFSVIPVKRNKTPYIKWVKYQNERAGEKQIKAWWGKWPEANIAVVTGKISEINILDIDTLEGWENVNQNFLSESFLTPISRTPGGGYHIFFEYQPGLSNGIRVLPGTDLGTDGGYATRKEKVKVYGYSKKNSYPMYRIIKFALWTGCRRSEIYDMRYQDIKNGNAHVIGKGDKERSVPLLPAAIRAVGKGDIGFVFWHPKEKDKITKEFKAICRACGIEDVHFHDLRHTAATDMLSSGMRLEYVQKVLGHESIRTTQIYVKILQSDLKREMQKMRSKRGQ